MLSCNTIKCFACYDHFQDKYFDKSWDLQNWLFYRGRPIKRKRISTTIPTLLPHKQISTPKKTSEIRAKQKEKEEVKFETGFGHHKEKERKRRGKTLTQGLHITNLTSFKEVLT